MMRIALFQREPARNGFEEARESLDRACAAAVRNGVDLLTTPEMFLSGYNIGAEAVRAAAEPVDGPMISGLVAMAARHKVGILSGFPELAPDGRVYNAIALIDAEGTLRAVCRKTHLYGEVDRAQFAAADTLCPVVEFGGWRVGLAICYDIEFPELVRAHALAGAEAILTPTANMAPYTGVATRIVPARAEENEVFVAYANYVGSEGRFDYCGLSCIVGPDGEDLARAGTGEEIIFADLTRDQLARVRSASTHLRDLRPELYARTTPKEGANDERD